MKYEIRVLKAKDIETCHKLLCENNKIKDENLDLSVLPKEFINYKKFEELTVNADTRFLVVENVEIDKVVGFLGYEIKENVIKILYTETSDKSNLLKTKISMLNFVIEKAKAGKNNIIYYTITDNQLDLCKGMYEIGFKMEKMIHGDGPSKIIMKWRNNG